MVSQLHHVNNWRLVISVFAVIVASWATSLPAAPINYGDFGPDPPGVTMYLDVTESSSTHPIPPGRYGEPDLNGNVLDFDPSEFAALASGEGGFDFIDVQLNYTLMAVPNSGITAMTVSESGDFTLFGGGTALTTVVAGLSIQIDILEVDGVPLAMPIEVSDNPTFIADLDNPGQMVVAPWANGKTFNFADILDENEIPFELGVTKAEVAIDNQLFSFSEDGTVAFIAKKDFRIGGEFEIVPEPASLTMMLLAIAGYGLVFRRRIARSIRERLC